MPGVKILVSGMPFGSVDDDYKTALEEAGEVSHVWPLDKQGGRQAVVKFKDVVEAVCGGIFTKKFKDAMGGELNCKMYLAQRRGKSTGRPKYEVESTAILVSNIDPDTTYETLETHFSAFGKILNIILDPEQTIIPETVCIAIIVYAFGRNAQSAVSVPLIHEVDKMVLDVQYLPRSYFYLLPPEATQPSRLKQSATTQYAGPNGDIKEPAASSAFIVTVVQLPEEADADSIKDSLSAYGTVVQCGLNRDNTATVEFGRSADASLACEIGWCYLHNTCCELVQLGKRVAKKRERDRNRERDRERDWAHNKANHERSNRLD
eukprot:TRINITY_DN27396_c0_g1_i1.p1 TRINITY_DN27396_c0_g1~~TRINITY_DN27396_c0_g1_i1.p1  ORF type:complete len:345 (+),score=57.95 TRINITY_DN27396_c0_g1_i1:76-1035(+)